VVSFSISRRGHIHYQGWLVIHHPGRTVPYPLVVVVFSASISGYGLIHPHLKVHASFTVALTGKRSLYVTIKQCGVVYFDFHGVNIGSNLRFKAF
jgi:hypothetical protein